MLLKCFLILSVVFLLEAASITKGIPVNVVYLDPADIQENAREKSHVRYLQNRNLDEKVQLSGRELKEADQHIPIPEGLDSNNDGTLFLKAKTAFLDKLANFRDQVDRFSLKTTQKKPTSEDWAGLNEKIQEVFKKYEKNGIRQNQGGFLAELTQVTGQWFQSFGGNNNNKPGGEEDEQQQNQGGLGQAWTNFSNSISQAFSNIGSNNQGGTTSNTVLGDTGVTTTTQAPGFFQNIVSNFFNNNNNQENKPGQEDTGSTPPPNVFQGAINNIINTFSQSTEKPNSSQGDTGESSTSSSGNPFINAIGQVFGQGTKPPGASGDNEATNKPSNFFENVFQNVFNQNQASTSQSQGTTSAPNIINQGLQQIQIPGQGGDINNIQQFQNAGQQIAQGFQNPQNIAQNLGQQVGGNSEDSQNNQLQQITGGLQNPQNFVSQAQNVGQQIGGNIPSGSQGNIGQQISEAFQNPQNFASQAQNVGQQIGGNIPSGSQGNIGQQISEAFQNPQNFASQAQNIGQQINGNGSGSQGSTGQAVGQQISQAFQNPQNFATQAQNIGQQLGGNLPQTGQQSSGSQGGVSTLDVNQIPVIGQQLNQNSQNPIQNFQTNPTNIINQIQSSTNQIQNPAASANNPINLVDTQNQQLNVNQINQIIPSNLQPQNSNEIQSTLTNQFNNGLNQLNAPNGSNNFLSGGGNPLNAATEILQSNQSQNGGQTSQQNVVKPVNEEKIERKVSKPVEKTKKEGEAEIMVAFER